MRQGADEHDGSRPQLDVSVGAGRDQPRLGGVPEDVHAAEAVVVGVAPQKLDRDNEGVLEEGTLSVYPSLWGGQKIYSKIMVPEKA